MKQIRVLNVSTGKVAYMMLSQLGEDELLVLMEGTGHLTIDDLEFTLVDN